MYERLTDRARTVMVLAYQAAEQLHHEFIGSEHVLLGLLREGDGIAANVLKHVGEGISENKVIAAIPPGLSAWTVGRPQGSQASKRIIESALKEAQILGHNYVGTEHLLLGLLDEKEGVAVDILSEVAPLDEFRKTVYDILGTKIDES